MNNKEQQLLKETCQLLEDQPEAVEFLLAYNDYIHKVDDIIDEDGSYRELLKMTSMASTVFTLPFWRKYGPQLLLVEQLINNQYADSVEWESDSEDWKRVDARCLSHSGYNMHFAVILMTKGYDALRKVSSRWRERAHLKHMEGQEPVTRESLRQAEFETTKHENCK